MPNCPNCQTWNPEDKTVCWRCQTPMPRPTPSRKRAGRRVGGVPISLWIALVFFVVMMIAAQCFISGMVRSGG